MGKKNTELHAIYQENSICSSPQDQNSPLPSIPTQVLQINTTEDQITHTSRIENTQKSFRFGFSP